MAEEQKKHHLVEYANGKSLDEINGSIEVPKNIGFWKTLFMYSGPGALVAVGYMDPGNWATSITGGQNFQFMLMSIILISSLIAMLLQYMAAKLGIVTQMDLAQAIRARTSKGLGIVLWIMTELAIMATDIAEVIGGAIALYLLFGIPIVWAVMITVLDVLVLLLLTSIGFRKIEALVVALILVIFLVFAYEVALSKPDWLGVLKGLVPSLDTIKEKPVVHGMTPLTGTLGIIGATVMPHNLYLHSAIAQTRKIDHSDEDDIARGVKFSAFDSNIQLSMAFFVNALLLIMGVAVFKSGVVEDTSFFGLYDALKNPAFMTNGLLAGVAKTGILSTLFAVALLASGQNSTITGTLTGQVIMEGFVHMRMPLWARRLVTRLLSIIPVLLCVLMSAGKPELAQHADINNLMENSQVFLAIALPFSMLPVLMFTNSPVEMHGKRFVNSWWIKICGWVSVITLVFLNIYNMPSAVQGFFGDNPSASQVTLANGIAWTVNIFILALLAWVLYDIIRSDKKLEAKHEAQADAE
ncbi:Nramp family divalent metal transporter [Fructilactobacillus cliffordii]|uniref:Nramp family divalent metal transporter n=1 Tax=Fructilactobacillus cliffordii TaxID=2940299 RepID=UPI0020935EC0|nr:Nramp family divalent metal transporter [Fructilactobacillus cliffordii]USS86062.1 Nramp family divalent metal transporter [Fructilactobacillus cliffordii]